MEMFVYYIKETILVCTHSGYASSDISGYKHQM
jgi:hypothetical protein